MIEGTDTNRSPDGDGSLAQTVLGGAKGAPPAELAGSRRRQSPVLQRVLWGGFWTLAVLAAVAVILYSVGGMWLRTPEMKSAYDELVLTGQQPAIEAAVVVPIPGCVCHSDDPVAQAQHSVYRIRDCFTCH